MVDDSLVDVPDGMRRCRPTELKVLQATTNRPDKV